MEFPQLIDAAAVDAALAADGFLLLKHSERCGISRQALEEVAAFLRDHPETPAGWIDVRGQRELSEAVTERTGITHASPQALWIRNGRVAWQATHFDITADALAALLAAGL